MDKEYLKEAAQAALALLRNAERAFDEGRAEQAEWIVIDAIVVLKKLIASERHPSTNAGTERRLLTPQTTESTETANGCRRSLQ